MVLNNCHDAEGLLIVFGGKQPSFEDIAIQDVLITPGAEFSITIRLDICELPTDMPEKWKDRNVNTIQVMFTLIRVEEYRVSPVQ